jgi:hypothetical protein
MLLRWRARTALSLKDFHLRWSPYFKCFSAKEKIFVEPSFQVLLLLQEKFFLKLHNPRARSVMPLRWRARTALSLKDFHLRWSPYFKCFSAKEKIFVEPSFQVLLLSQEKTLEFA